MKIEKYILLCLLPLLSTPLLAQESLLQQAYRKKVLNYNQDIKAAQQRLGMEGAYRNAAKSDFKPKLMGGANFSYTGNPTELAISSPQLGGEHTFAGEHMQYGVGLSLEQPLYTGGALKGQLQMATSKQKRAKGDLDRIVNSVLFEADVKYWRAIAQKELVGVAQAYLGAVERLEQVAKHKVEVGYADRNDLLMTEVKLNDAKYKLLRTENSAEIAKLALYSFAAIDEATPLALDTSVLPVREGPSLGGDLNSVVAKRPELMVLNSQLELQYANKKVAKSRFLPQLSIGVDGNYSSPGYNFKSDLVLNYVFYTKLSVPIFEWGKRKSTTKAFDYAIQMVHQEKSKVEDNISLEIKSAYHSYTQAVDQVLLTEHSLEKAQESETLTMERYKEGRISIVEVLNAQLYHQEAQINYIQSKLDAQLAKSDFERATLAYKTLP